MSDHAADQAPETRTEQIARQKAEERAARFADALDRAWRTFKQAILYDALFMSAGGILDLTERMPVTSQAFWTAAGGLFLKSLVITGFSYVKRIREKQPPQ